MGGVGVIPQFHHFLAKTFLTIGWGKGVTPLKYVTVFFRLPQGRHQDTSSFRLLIQFLAKKSDRGCYHRKLRPRISYITPTNKCLASPLRPHVAYILVVCTIKKAIHFYTGRFLLTDPLKMHPPPKKMLQLAPPTLDK